ncbi:hypothetical protein EZ428_06710 [Pedobacter frigiditerrae]|uniref:Uncharacterized protein n=1 Tax=Pedobacter frigiditerrae TaxID=2530452 RepID=A0A4R0N4Z6_9SPHI|nr:hypothetical protein [Pedobacter frigiditerrae]TCC94457.1 hypothetical protein EZ428_06710 [Pedobacter frigiditerrae]
MNLRRVLFAIAIIVLGYVVISNIFSVKKLSKNVVASKMPTRDFAYADLFLNPDRFSNTFTFYGNAKRDVVGGYVVGKNYDLVVYKIKNLKPEKTKSISEVFTLMKSDDYDLTQDVIYDASYKTSSFRFSVAQNDIKPLKQLKINYSGDVLSERLDEKNILIFNLSNVSGLAAFADAKQVEFAINKRSFLTKKFSLQIAIYKNGNDFYFAALYDRESPEKPVERNVIKELFKN